MRAIRNLDDVALALRELFDFKDTFTSRNISLNGRKVIGASPAASKGEYVTYEQLPVISKDDRVEEDQYFTVVFTKSGEIADGESIPSYVFGKGREGIPYQVWVMAGTAPSGGSLTINIQHTIINPVTDAETTANILSADLQLPTGQSRRVYSSTFVDPVPKFQQLSWITPSIVSGHNAALVTIGIVVKRIKLRN